MPNQLTPVQDYLYHETESQSNESVNNNTDNVTPSDKAQSKNQKDLPNEITILSTLKNTVLCIIHHFTSKIITAFQISYFSFASFHYISLLFFLILYSF